VNRRTRPAIVLVGLVLLTSAGCRSSAARARGSEEVLRLGVFPNLTHGPAYVGLGSGIFRRDLEPTRVDVRYFNSGTDAGMAILAGEVDATYIGPGPTAELFERSGKVAVVSGATAGGASLVVRNGSGIETAEDLRGKRVAVPGIGNTQDVALRTWLHEQGLEARDEGGDVTVLAVESYELLHLFRVGQLDAAWAATPWPGVLTTAGVARLLVDEASLWSGGRFATTHLLVSTIYMDAHPHVVRRLVRANVDAIRFIQRDLLAALSVALRGLERAGAPRLPRGVMTRAWSNLNFTWDPVAASMAETARRAYELGYLDRRPVDILDVYRLDDLNAILREMGVPAVEPSR
jgi:NitT/TauT family transport system substrate-binding protein